ncbi:MAG: DUF3086 domain-containing protein [Candidatus Thorarchaeota archaeon]
MGRTIRTFRDAINTEAQRWSHFKRTLRPEERELLEQLFDSARSRGDAGTMMPTRTTEIILVSAMIDILRSLKDMESRLTRLEKWMVEQTD